MLVDLTRKQTVDLIQDPANAGPNATPEPRKVGGYASFMDEAGIGVEGHHAAEISAGLNSRNC